MERPFEPLGINCREVAVFHQTSPQNRIAIAHLSHEMDIGDLADRVEKRDPPMSGTLTRSGLAGSASMRTRGFMSSAPVCSLPVNAPHSSW